jgi:hypothetical protein
LRLRNGPEKKSGHHRPGNTFLGATENQRSRRAKRTRARPEGSRMANPPRQGSNFLEYNPAKEVLSQEAWNANSALTFYKLLKNLRQTAKLLPLVHPQTNVKYMVDWPFVEGDLERQAMPTYLGGQGAVNVALRKTINDLVYTYLIKLLTPCWPRIEKALVLTDYDDDASPHHVLNVHGHITERMPMVARLISAIKKKTFKGPVVHNKSLEDHIQGFKGPKDASDQALTNMNAWLDETDTLWTMLQAYPECLATEGQRWTELLRQMKVWSVSDSNKFPTDIFINDMRSRATSTGVKSLSDLITSFSTWIEAEILERQASKSNKVISANATTPSGSGCAKHGPNAKHTTAECKGLMKRPQGQQSQRTNGKAPFNGRPRFNSDKVHFNQDREAAGNRMHGKRPPFKKAYKAGYNSQAGSNGGHHGPKHQGGSLEELLMGNYKGKHFDPTKSRKYTGLAAYFQQSGQSTTGALPSSSSNDGASGNAILPLQDLQGLPPPYHNFAFALTLRHPADA